MLFRSLDALLAGDSAATNASEGLLTLPVSQLQPGKYQPRTHMDQASLESLANSIREQGVMQPIIVREVAANRYEIIAGERRWRASQLAGLTEVPVIVREIAKEGDYIVFLGAGNITQWAYALPEQLKAGK